MPKKKKKLILILSDISLRHCWPSGAEPFEAGDFRLKQGYHTLVEKKKRSATDFVISKNECFICWGACGLFGSSDGRIVRQIQQGFESEICDFAIPDFRSAFYSIMISIETILNYIGIRGLSSAPGYDDPLPDKYETPGCWKPFYLLCTIQYDPSLLHLLRYWR